MPTDPNAHIEARYTDAVLPIYKGNPLIEALPPSRTDEELFDALELRPDFSPEQREWPNHLRMQMVTQLANSVFPLRRNIDLARTLELMLLQGYQLRSFRSAIETVNRIHDDGVAGRLLKSPTTVFSSTPLTKVLFGCPGAGKSSAVRRVLSLFPQSIYHRSHGVYQVPFLYIETPHDGTSIKGLAHGIFRRLDEVIPGADYYNLYCNKARTTDEALLGQLSRVLSLHHVGMLVCDEIQNVMNAHKNKQSVMTLLVSASNEFGVPLLFIGTHKARGIMELDFRQARRSAGIGIPEWDRLNRDGNPKEWALFLQNLEDYQWVKHPVPLEGDIENALYWHSQGIADLALKLFMNAQIKAIQDGSERLTVELIDEIAKERPDYFNGMVEALRTNNISRLVQYPDLGKVKVEDLPPANLRKPAEAVGSPPQGRQSFRPAPEPQAAQKRPAARLKKGASSSDGKVVSLQSPDLRNITTMAQSGTDSVAATLQAQGLVGDLNLLLPG